MPSPTGSPERRGRGDRRGRRLDTRQLGLEIGTGLARWLTGTENLHYGLWSGLEPVAANLGAAQAAYTDRLISHLPTQPLDVLDVGGGAGAVAARLIEAGHRVEIVVPSAFLAERCRANAPESAVHRTIFEDFETDRRFDLCLFAESLQYIPLELALRKARSLLREDGRVLVADCFRSEGWTRADGHRAVGGGHRLASFHEAVRKAGLAVEKEEDVTDATAPSIDVEQALYTALGDAVRAVDAELVAKRPALRWVLARALRLALGARRRARLAERLFARERTSETFRRCNRYMFFRLRPASLVDPPH